MEHWLVWLTMETRGAAQGGGKRGGISEIVSKSQYFTIAVTIVGNIETISHKAISNHNCYCSSQKGKSLLTAVTLGVDALSIPEAS